MVENITVQKRKREMCDSVMQDKLTDEEYASLFGRVSRGKSSNEII
jgi:hypothetical protein